MSKWIRDYDSYEFDSYDEAYEDSRDSMDMEDLAEYYENYVSYDELLHWAINSGAFWESDISEDLYSAEQDYFEDHYHEIDGTDD